MKTHPLTLALAWSCLAGPALAQTSPAAPSLALRIERAASGLTLRFPQPLGATSELFASSNLTDWAALPVSFSPGPDGTVTVTRPIDSASRYFRVVQFRPGGETADLVGYWPLNGTWRDAGGRYDLVPSAPANEGFAAANYPGPAGNLAYGPTRSATGNGALAPSLTAVDESNGVTLEGWVSLPDDNTGGTLFGFGDGAWDEAKLNIRVAWGFLQVSAGRQGDGALAQYERIGDTCWHHVALVLPAGFRSGQPFRFYLDGRETAPSSIGQSITGTTALAPRTTLWGSPFRIGAFTPPDAGSPGSAGGQRVDEVRLWSRALPSDRIAALALPGGNGPRCDSAPAPNWAPGPRFVPPAVLPPPQPTLGVHVLGADTVAVITDPNPWLKERLAADCGAFLRSLETHRASLEAWVGRLHYQLAASEVVAAYRPGVLAGVTDPAHLRLATADGAPVPFRVLGTWPQATREFRAPRARQEGGEEHTDAAEVVYYTYLQLDRPLPSGTTVRVSDAWNSRTEWTYDDDRSLSWALKVNQVGYLPDAPRKYAYLGSWLGPAAGAMNLDAFEGAAFQLCRETDGSPVFTGRVAFRGDESVSTNHWVLSGEKVFQLDFSEFRTPGRYYVRVPRIGRSWAFDIGQDALGSAFFTHLRGLYQQRCGTDLLPAFTRWPRGDAHTNSFRAAFPTELGAYDASNATDGWGFLDAQGKYPAFPSGVDPVFGSVAATATHDLLPGVRGGWHDAADYDRPGWRHLLAVQDLVVSYLLYPANFTDNQLNLPESGNGIPDILDEAVWGTEVWRRAQEPDGRVALHLETDSHPQVRDPAIDPQPYYLGLATHDTSIQYAEHAARLARALARAGAPDPSRRFLDSARRAYAFGISGGPRISVSITVGGLPVTWSEPAALNRSTRVRALIQLWLATGDAAYRAELDSPAMTAAFRQEVADLYWRSSGFDLVDVALAPDSFPAGWATLARDGIVHTADDWLVAQETHAYRKLWYAVDHGYFGLMGWGLNGFKHVRELVVAWKITNDERYRAAALLAVDWMHGANPQGRVNTTGLGRNHVVHPLHLPSDSDALAEPVPGITIYAYTGGTPWSAGSAVYGLFEDARPNEGFAGSALPQLPPPWNKPGLSIQQLKDFVDEHVPLWRRIVALEDSNVNQMEFAVNETISHAAAVTGCLMGPGWTPGRALVERAPRSPAELQDALWYHP